MNMKKISSIVAGALMAFGVSTSANALVVQAGNITITFRAYDAGTTGYGNTPGLVCDDVLECDTKAGAPSPFSFGSEDTWGIFSVQSIIRTDSDPTTPDENIFTAGVLKPGQAGKYLTGMFGGLSDEIVSVGTNGHPTSPAYTTYAWSTGGWLNMYWNDTNIDASMGPDGRDNADPMVYAGITDGTLALSANFSAAADGTFPNATYVSQFANNDFSGKGSGFLDITGGDLGAQLDTNAEEDAYGNMHDLYLKSTFGTQNQDALDAGWTVDASGDVQGEATDVPEPGSLALLGLGFAGLAGLRRRRAAK